jgi:hypothetical protein
VQLRGFNQKNWFYPGERVETSKVRAIASNIRMLNAILGTAATHSAEAHNLIVHGKCNGAIGALVSLGSILDEAKALYGAALALHRVRTS